MSSPFVMYLLLAVVVVGAILNLVVIVQAFRDGFMQGLLCSLVPFYIWYYMAVRLQHPLRGLVFLVGGPLFGAASWVLMNDAMFSMAGLG